MSRNRPFIFLYHFIILFQPIYLFGQTNKTITLSNVEKLDPISRSQIANIGCSELASKYKNGQLKDSVNLNRGLISYYPFDINGNDKSGNKYHLTEYGDLSYEVGKFCNAVKLDGASEYLGIDSITLTEENAVSIWYKVESTPGSNNWSTFISGNSLNSCANEDVYTLLWAENRNDQFAYRYQCDTDNTTGYDIDDGKWHHMVMNIKDTIQELYLDGELIDQQTKLKSTAQLVEYLTFGREQDTPNGGWQANQRLYGLIDEVRMYDRSLNELEIQLLYCGIQELSGLEEIDAFYYSKDTMVCQETYPVIWQTQIINSEGQFCDTSKNSIGCIEINCINVSSFIPVQQINIDTSVCLGGSLIINGITLDEGSTAINYSSKSGCDSMVIYNLTTLPIIVNKIDSAIICDSEAYLWNNELYEIPGNYLDTIANADGCLEKVSLFLSSDNPIGASYIIELCEGNEILLGNELITQEGIYIDTLVSDLGCTFYDTINVIVEEIAILEAIIINTSNSDGLIEIISNTEGDYLWSNGAQEPQINNLSPGDYHLTFTSNKGCVLVKSYTVEFESSNLDRDFDIPNIFSPLSDHLLNQTFNPKLPDHLSIKEIAIYDRWGNQVFSCLSSNCTTGWDGTFDGTTVEQGVYVGYLKYQIGTTPYVRNFNLTVL